MLFIYLGMYNLFFGIFDLRVDPDSFTFVWLITAFINFLIGIIVLKKGKK